MRIYVIILLLLGSVFFGFPSFAQDAQIVSALKLAKKGQWSVASQAMNRVSDPLAQQTLSWLAYTDNSHNVEFNKIVSFMLAHPDFPYQITMRKNAEMIMPVAYSPAQIIGWFADKKPITAKGMNAYLGALIKTGRRNEAKEIINNWWADASLNREGQKEIFGKYGSLISSSANKKRLNALLYKGEYSNALAIASVLGGSYKSLANARIALAKQNKNVGSLINAVPASLQNDEGLMYERLRWRRRNDQTQGAIDILNNSPTSSKMYDPSKWWKERHIIARRFMEDENYRAAYNLVSNHKQKDGFSYSQAEWLSGFLALEFLNNPRQAINHFNNLYKNVKTPISKARAGYWAGKAAEKLGNKEVADKWYLVAAKYPERYYGQTAFDVLYSGRVASFNPELTVSTASRLQFKKQKFARIAIWLNKAGFRDDAAAFIKKMGEGANSPEQYAVVADFAHNLGLDQEAIRLASKCENETGVKLNQYNFPKKVAAVKNVKNVEWALVHAIMRQESRFDVNAKSHVGARGLMQLMPATAKQTARKIGVSHRTDWLTSRPSHNVLLGSNYLRQMLDRYNGNYPMAIAAYNAGPGRVDRWIEEIGDPRTTQIDLIDWVELIPIYETRNYVQRVMEGVYVYRGVLGSQNKPVSSLHLASR